MSYDWATDIHVIDFDWSFLFNESIIYKQGLISVMRHLVQSHGHARYSIK